VGATDAIGSISPTRGRRSGCDDGADKLKEGAKVNIRAEPEDKKADAATKPGVETKMPRPLRLRRAGAKA